MFFLTNQYYGGKEGRSLAAQHYSYKMIIIQQRISVRRKH